LQTFYIQQNSINIHFLPELLTQVVEKVESFQPETDNGIAFEEVI
jgi:hypothetical protein